MRELGKGEAFFLSAGGQQQRGDGSGLAHANVTTAGRTNCIVS